jgi:2-polyprenyl-3-methyl-5-hydroxy-6-metoxy-1,4-benzoquinol methylase
MMTSFPQNLFPILREIRDLKPTNIMDVGAGFGKFGLLVRELLLSEAAEAGDMTPVPKFKITCVEEAPYFMNQPWHRSLYDRHLHADLFSIPPAIYAEHDLILMIDVVEHAPKERIINLLRAIQAAGQGKTRILISTPREVCFYKQKFYGCALHVSQWTAEDFAAFPRTRTLESAESHLVVIA